MWLTIGLLLKGPVGQTDTAAVQTLHHIVWEANHFLRDMCFWWTSSYVRPEEKIDHPTRRHSIPYYQGPTKEVQGKPDVMEQWYYPFLPCLMDFCRLLWVGRAMPWLMIPAKGSCIGPVYVLGHFSWKRLSLIDNGRRWFGWILRRIPLLRWSYGEARG